MRFSQLIIAATLVMTPPALAHEAKGPNGGRMVDAGEYHVELVVQPAEVAVYVTDSGERPVATAGFKGTAILMAEGKAQRIALEPGQNNQLTGKSNVALPADVKGAVQLTTPAGKTAQGQFN
jgi:hypothetical protein